MAFAAFIRERAAAAGLSGHPLAYAHDAARRVEARKPPQPRTLARLAVSSCWNLTATNRRGLGTTHRSTLARRCCARRPQPLASCLWTASEAATALEHRIRGALIHRKRGWAPGSWPGLRRGPGRRRRGVPCCRRGVLMLTRRAPVSGRRSPCSHPAPATRCRCGEAARRNSPHVGHSANAAV